MTLTAALIDLTTHVIYLSALFSFVFTTKVPSFEIDIACTIVICIKINRDNIIAELGFHYVYHRAHAERQRTFWRHGCGEMRSFQLSKRTKIIEIIQALFYSSWIQNVSYRMRYEDWTPCTWHHVTDDLGKVFIVLINLSTHPTSRI